MNKELALKLMEEGDEEEALASRKKKGKVGESSPTLFCTASEYNWIKPFSTCFLVVKIFIAFNM